jgi:hypothetical protein
MIYDQEFYTFGDNTFSNRGFTWAASIHPRSEVVHQICPTCGSVKHYPIGEFDVTVERGSKYPDILGCGAFPFLIVSEKVVRAWKGAGLSCFHTYDIGVVGIKSTKLRNEIPPAYFRIEIDGRCQIDLEASGAKIIRFCPDCQHLETVPPVITNFRMIPDSWDGSSLFRDIRLYPCVNFCTQNILDIVFQQELTNFFFEPGALHVE